MKKLATVLGLVLTMLMGGVRTVRAEEEPQLIPKNLAIQLAATGMAIARQIEVMCQEEKPQVNCDELYSAPYPEVVGKVLDYLSKTAEEDYGEELKILQQLGLDPVVSLFLYRLQKALITTYPAGQMI